MQHIIEMLLEICEDTSTPKQVREKLTSISQLLRNGEDPSMIVNKALHELDDVVNDSNLQPFTRTQLWSVVSLLEEKNHR